MGTPSMTLTYDDEGECRTELAEVGEQDSRPGMDKALEDWWEEL